MIVFSEAAAAQEVEVSEEVVVTATRAPVPLDAGPLPTLVLDRDFLEESGARDLADLLERAPGIDVDRTPFGAVARLRGLDPDQVLILVDGQRVAGRKGEAFDLTRIPVESLERVEVVEGAAGALWGSEAMGGVIHLITRRPARRTEGQATLRGSWPTGADLSGSASWRRGEEAGRVTVGLHQRAAVDRDPSDRTTTLDARHQVLVSGSLERRAGEIGGLRGDFSYTLTDAQGVDAPLSGAVFDRRNLIEDARLAIRPNLGEATELWAGVGLYRDQYALDQRRSGALDVYEETREAQGQLGVSRQARWGRHTATALVEGLAETLRADRLAGQPTRQRLGLALQDALVLEQVQVHPSVRWDVDSRFGSWPTARLALRYDPVPPLALHLSGGSGFRAPSFRELYLRFQNDAAGYRVDGNPELEPERSVGVSGGATLTGDRAWVSLRGSWDELRGLITTELGEGTGAAVDRFGYVNVERARTRGGTLALGLDPAPGLAVEGAYTLTLAEDLSRDRWLEARAPHRGSGTVGLGPESTRLLLRGVVEGPRPFYPDRDGDGAFETEWEPAWVGLDATASQRLGPALTARAGVENLLDAGDAVRLPMAPRTFFLALQGDWR